MISLVDQECLHLQNSDDDDDNHGSDNDYVDDSHDYDDIHESDDDHDSDDSDNHDSYDDYGSDEHEVVSHDNLMVVWALSAGHCLKFPSFSYLVACNKVRL